MDLIKKVVLVSFLFSITHSWAQIDFSNTWEDYYSYNNVKDVVKDGDDIYAISDNGLFIYNKTTKSIDKFSSVNGLSGEETSSICFSKNQNKIIIGYETGLIEIVDVTTKKVIALKDIINFNYLGSKRINNITLFQDKLFIATPFAVVVYNIEKSQFGDTYFIGNQSSEIKINQIKVFDTKIYAATENGIFVANYADPNLIDFNNWTPLFSGNFPSLEVFNNTLYTINNKTLYKVENNNLTTIKTYGESLLKLKASSTNLVISTSKIAYVNDISNTEIAKTTITPDYNFNLNMAIYEDGELFLGTKEFGVLSSSSSNLTSFNEIHPDGPLTNYPFSITANNSNLAVVYGSYDGAYTPQGRGLGLSSYSNNSWTNISYAKLNKPDLVHVTYDPYNSNKMYVSSWGGGMLVLENNEVVADWNHTNSGLERLILASAPNYVSTRINGTAFDDDGNLWVANAWVDKRVKKYSKDGTWSSFDMSSVISNTAPGLNELIVDKSNTFFMGSRRNGVLVFNEKRNKKRAINTDQNSGGLPDLNVRSIQVDNGNRLWIGTKSGLVILYNVSSIFDVGTINAEPLIILDNNVPQKLLGDDAVNSIAIDGAENKWFGTENGGVIQTSPNGTKTLNQFNKDNSPLPSNNILKIAIDKSSGKVFFATDKGIVAFNSKVAEYGDVLPEVYAYPNPSTKNNDFITIDGRNGAHLPNKTNVKILDTAGNLVFETNVKEGQEEFGGKVVWNKTNLAGNKVASGVYIVLLSFNEAIETAITKIAIIN